MATELPHYTILAFLSAKHLSLLVVLGLSGDLVDGLPATTLQGLLRLVADLGELLVLCDLALLDALVKGLSADVEVLDEANVVVTPVVLLAEDASGAEHEVISSAAPHGFPVLRRGRKRKGQKKERLTLRILCKFQSQKRRHAREETIRQLHTQHGTLPSTGGVVQGTYDHSSFNRRIR